MSLIVRISESCKCDLLRSQYSSLYDILEFLLVYVHTYRLRYASHGIYTRHELNSLNLFDIISPTGVDCLRRLGSNRIQL